MQQGGTESSKGSPMLISPMPAAEHTPAQQVLPPRQSRLAQGVAAEPEEVHAPFHARPCASHAAVCHGYQLCDSRPRACISSQDGTKEGECAREAPCAGTPEPEKHQPTLEQLQVLDAYKAALAAINAPLLPQQGQALQPRPSKRPDQAPGRPCSHAPVSGSRFVLPRVLLPPDPAQSNAQQADRVQAGSHAAGQPAQPQARPGNAPSDSYRAALRAASGLPRWLPGACSKGLSVLHSDLCAISTLPRERK